MDSKYHDATVRCLNHICKLSGAALLTVALAFPVSGRTYLPMEIPATDATNHLNEQVIVRDVVTEVALRSSVALLNLNQRFPDSPLAGVIRGHNTNRFSNLESYLGQRVEISGRITTSQGRPQIVLTTTNQIKILGAAPANLQPQLVAGTRTTPIADLPTAISRVVAQPTVPAQAHRGRPVWGIIVICAVIMVVFRSLLSMFWRRGAEQSGGRASQSALTQLAAPANAMTEPSTADEWKQRALVAEAMAGQQGQILREKLMPELAEFAKQSLVQGLYAQRNALIETQQEAQQALGEMEARLAALQLSLPERIRAYEKRISELEKEVETQGEEMRALTRATLALVRKKLETERERTSSRFN